MNTIEALQLLDNVAQAYQGSREDHIKLQQAVNVLRELINKVAEESKPKKDK